MLEKHGLVIVRAERGGVDKFGMQWFALRSRVGRFKLLLQGKQARSHGSAKEAIVADGNISSAYDTATRVIK